MLERRRILSIIVALALLAILARLVPGPRTIDDAFITFRYSRNLAEGLGFVYNPGVQTLGTTTPLFALLLAAISAVTDGQDFQWYAIVLSALADAGTVALLFLLVRRLIPNPWIAALPAALWAVSPMSVTFVIGGMETSLSIFWMAAGTWLYVSSEGQSPGQKQRTEYAIGAVVGLAILTRVDALLWIAPLLGTQWLEKVRASSTRSLPDRFPWRTWLAAGGVLLPWMLFSAAYFGSPLPNSVTAKRFAYLIPPRAALEQMLRTYANVFFTSDTFGAIGVMLSAVLYLTLTLFALLYVARRCPRLLPFLLYPWIYAAVFSILNPLIFRWYMAPPLPALIVGIVLGAWNVVRPLAERKRLVYAARGIVGALGLLWLFTSLNAWTLHPDHGLDRPAPRMAWHALELLYQQMGSHLRDDLGVMPATRVASGDIGAIGYFSGATIVDTVGLVTPELTRYYPLDPSLVAEGQNYAIPPRLIEDTQPAYLVTMEGFIRNGLAQEAWFQQQYTLLTEYPFPFYGSSMQLYRREAS